VRYTLSMRNTKRQMLMFTIPYAPQLAQEERTAYVLEYHRSYITDFRQLKTRDWLHKLNRASSCWYLNIMSLLRSLLLNVMQLTTTNQLDIYRYNRQNLKSWVCKCNLCYLRPCTRFDLHRSYKITTTRFCYEQPYQLQIVILVLLSHIPHHVCKYSIVKATTRVLPLKNNCFYSPHTWHAIYYFRRFTIVFIRLNTLL
jgi:hypothetical protein